MITAELLLSQSARFEFDHQPLDLFTASALPLRDFWVFSHPDSPAKKPQDEQVWILRRLPSRISRFFFIEKAS
jgi:hypothetical protein